MSIASVFVSSVVSFGIAGTGWYLLDKRANKTSKRSETFSLLNPTIAILHELETFAENRLNEVIGNIDAVRPESKEQIKTKRVKQQVYEAKCLSRFNLFRSRLEQLKKRKITIPDSMLIELKQALTIDIIDSPIKYQRVLNATQAIQHELYSAFDREHYK